MVQEATKVLSLMVEQATKGHSLTVQGAASGLLRDVALRYRELP